MFHYQRYLNLHLINELLNKRRILLTSSYRNKTLLQCLKCNQQVHRLDKNTTGVLLFAKTKSMHKHLVRLFRERKIEKRYWAILNGTPTPSEGEFWTKLFLISVKGPFKHDTLRERSTNFFDFDMQCVQFIVKSNIKL